MAVVKFFQCCCAGLALGAGTLCAPHYAHSGLAAVFGPLARLSHVPHQVPIRADLHHSAVKTHDLQGEGAAVPRHCFKLFELGRREVHEHLNQFADKDALQERWSRIRGLLVVAAPGTGGECDSSALCAAS